MHVVNDAYNGTPEGSKLRAYLVEEHVRLSGLPLSRVRDILEENPDFVLDVCSRYASFRGEALP